MEILFGALVALALGVVIKLRMKAAWALALMPAALYLAIFALSRAIVAAPAPWLPVLIAALPLAPWLALSLFAWRRRIDDTLPEPYDAARHALPADLDARVGRAVDALREEGFAPFGELGDDVGTARARTVHLRNAATTETAVVSAVAAGGRTLRFEVLLAADLDDGRRVNVTDSATLVPLPILPEFAGARFPSVREPRRLLRVFRAMVRREAGSAAPVAAPHADAAEYARSVHRRVAEAAVRAGYYRPVPGGWKRTARGALLGMWRVVFPGLVLERRRIFRRERELLAELGMADAVRGSEPAPRAPGRLGAALLAGAVLFVVAGSLMERAVPGAEGDAFARLVPAEGAPVEEAWLRGTPTRPDALPAGFAVPADFSGAVRALERLGEGRAIPMQAADTLGNTYPSPAFFVMVPRERAASLLAAAQPAFLERGFLLVQYGWTFGSNPQYLALYPSPDASEPIRWMGRHGRARLARGDAAARWLGEIANTHPLVLTGIGDNYLRARLAAPPTAAGAVELAERVRDFCPRVLETGPTSLAALADRIRVTGELYCWWD